MKTVAFVPLRLNSQRVAGKNLRLLGGEPLINNVAFVELVWGIRAAGTKFALS